MPHVDGFTGVTDPSITCFEMGELGQEDFYGFRDSSEPPRYVGVAYNTESGVVAASGPYSEWAYEGWKSPEEDNAALDMAVGMEGMPAGYGVNVEFTCSGEYPLGLDQVAASLAHIVYARRAAAQ